MKQPPPDTGEKEDYTMGGRGSGSGFREGGSRPAAAMASTASSARTKSTSARTPRPLSQSQIAQQIIRAHNTAPDIDDRVALGALRDAQHETDLSFSGLLRSLSRAATSEGFSNSPSLNDARNRSRIMKFLDRIAPGEYEFRQVTLGTGVVPGFGFMGMPVRGKIQEWRLFHK